MRLILPNNPGSDSIINKFKHLTIRLKIAKRSPGGHPMLERPATMGNLIMHYTYIASKWMLSYRDTTWTSDLVHEQFSLRYMWNLADDLDLRVSQDLRSKRVRTEWIGRLRRAAHNVLASTIQVEGRLMGEDGLVKVRYQVSDEDRDEDYVSIWKTLQRRKNEKDALRDV